MQQFCSIDPELPLLFPSLVDETASSLQIELPAVSLEKVVELDDDENVVQGEASSGDELCLEKGASLLYGGGKPPTQKSSRDRSIKDKAVFVDDISRERKEENRDAQ